MVNKKRIDQVLIDGLHVDEEGIKTTKTFNIGKVMELGIEDVPMFLKGLLDAENDEDFTESNLDYVKGYKYGKTGNF